MTGEKKPICGVVMPISAIDGCAESHWADVLDIISEAVEAAGFESNLVSNADDIGIIHKRIIQNLYDNPIVVCDVSGKNPNVMFELGLRLAFDKPTVIIKDEKTSYSFDTSAIEHLEYPRDLRFSKIVEFKQKLSEKIRATHARSISDPTYTTFLKHFGEFTIAKLDKKEVTSQEFILEELRSIRSSIRHLEFTSRTGRDLEEIRTNRRLASERSIDICLKAWPQEKIDEALSKAKEHPVIITALVEGSPEHSHLTIRTKPGCSKEEKDEIESSIRAVRGIRRNVRSKPDVQN